MTMRDAYVELVTLVSAHKGVERLERQYQCVRDVLQTTENIRSARKWRAKAVVRLMQQVQDRRTYSVLRSSAGHLISHRRGIACELVEYWSGVVTGGSKTERECLQWLHSCGLPAQWRTLVPLPWKPCTDELVAAALRQMDPSSSPGDDGIRVGVYQAFSGFFVPHMVTAYGKIEHRGIPESWVVALVRTLAKEPGSAAVESQRPIAFQKARLQWLTGMLLLQVEDALFQIVPQAKRRT